ncbi:MAG: phytanoyl-CoA dioxygenase family protein [Cyanobacteria bacterium P01_G01_bin.54]
MVSIRNIEGWDKAMGRAKVLTYDTTQFKFTEVFANIFKIHPISRLHEAILAKKHQQNGSAVELSYKDNRGLRDWLTQQAKDSWFYPVYFPFVTEVIVPFFYGHVSYAQHPRFRVHLAGGPSVSKWHRDTDITGRFDQITAWVPAVDCSGTNALWVESDYGKRDYQPVTVKYGEVLLFDGGLYHGSVANETDVTRVGFDLRFAPLATRKDADLGILSQRPAGFEATRIPGGRY